MVVIAVIALVASSFPTTVFGDTVDIKTPEGIFDEQIFGNENEIEASLPNDDEDQAVDEEVENIEPDDDAKTISISEVFAFNDVGKYIELYLGSAAIGEKYYLMTAPSENGTLMSQLSFEVSSDDEFLLIDANQIAAINNFDLKNLNRVIWLCPSGLTKVKCHDDFVDKFTYTKLESAEHSWSRDFENGGEIKLSTRTPGAANVFKNDDGEVEGPELLDMCADILLNEISFSEPEKFIEIVNTANQTVDLADCALRRGSKFIYLDGQLAPNELASFSVSDSNLTQTNNSVNIYVYDVIKNENVGAVAYKAKAGASYAWLDVDGVEGWYSTFAMTPGAANIYQQFPTCEAGKHLNVATGNCVKDPDPPTECAEGQYRNPATGRCKKLDSEKTLAECAEGQFRNPLTNRCKKIASEDELSLCAEGWERNPETNRCRKTPIGSEAAYAVEPVAPTDQSRTWLWVGGGGAALLSGLIAWQFRPEIGRLLAEIISKVKR
jgi:hypothetical protein